MQQIGLVSHDKFGYMLLTTDIACPLLLSDAVYCVCLQRSEGNTTPVKPKKRQPLCPPDKESKGFTLGRGRTLTPPTAAAQPAAAPGASAAPDSAADGAAEPQPGSGAPDGLPQEPARLASASAPQLGPQAGVGAQAGAADSASPLGSGPAAGQALLQQLRNGSGVLADGVATAASVSGEQPAGVQGAAGGPSSVRAENVGAAESVPGVQAAGRSRVNGFLPGAEGASGGPRSVQGTAGATPAESPTPPGHPSELMPRCGEAAPAPVREAEAGDSASTLGQGGYDGATAAGVAGNGANGMQPMGNSAAGQMLLQQLQAQPDQGKLLCDATLCNAARCLALTMPTKQRHAVSRPSPSCFACVADVAK